MQAVVDTCRKKRIPRRLHPPARDARRRGSLGLNPNRCKRPSVIIIADKIQLYPPEFYQKGMDIMTVPTVRNPA